jgi:hypothetical protein
VLVDVRLWAKLLRLNDPQATYITVLIQAAKKYFRPQEDLKNVSPISKTRWLKGARAPVIPFKNKNNNSAHLSLPLFLTLSPSLPLSLHLSLSLSFFLWPVKVVCEPCSPVREREMKRERERDRDKERESEREIKRERER